MESEETFSSWVENPTSFDADLTEQKKMPV